MQTTTATVPTPSVLPQGATVVNSKAVSPVYVTRIRAVGKDDQTIELQLEQLFERPLNGTNGVLGITMAGHNAFQSGPVKRIAWQNFYTKMVLDMGLCKSHEELLASQVVGDTGEVIRGAMLINKGEGLPLQVPRGDGTFYVSKLIREDTFIARTWKEKDATGKEVTRIQQPKRAGKDGDVLTNNGRNIYQNTKLSFQGADTLALGKAWDEDIIIPKDNAVIGSTVRAAMDKANIALPTIPGVPKDTVESQADPALQNAGIGETSNLIHATEGNTRTQPENEQQGAADTTKAQDARVAGERPVRNPS